MTEDEAWDDIEDSQQRGKLIAARMMAVEAAQKFCVMYKDEMSIMTLRKAFEMGYMRAHHDGL